MCPIVPIFRCGLLRSNFSFAIVSNPYLRGLQVERAPDLRGLPFWIQGKTSRTQITGSMERGTGFEPATIALEERDSTVELPPPCCQTQTSAGLQPSPYPQPLEPGTGIEPVTSSLPRTRSTN